MHIQPYLFFEGRCDEAVEFYRDALGAEVLALVRYTDSPVPPSPEMCPPSNKDKVMHMAMRIGETTVMGSDGLATGTPTFRGFALSLAAPDVDEVERLFNVLADGGRVEMPLAETFFSPRFGMVFDRFGVCWMVLVDPETVAQ